MRTIMEHVSEKQRVFSQLPFFSYLRDVSFSPAERLSFVPAGAPFIMAFADLNKYILHVQNTDDPLQKLINVHSEEDATHYRMYLKDLETLGYDTPLRYSESLRFLWDDKRKHCRQTCYVLTALLANASSKMRLIIVEAVEAAGAAAFDVFADLAREYRDSTGRELVFFGQIHKDLETGHTMGTNDIEERLHDIILTEDERGAGRRLVDQVFEAFSAMMQELLEYVRWVQATQASPLPAGAPHGM